MLLFLGAGASKPFGIPTMQGFLELFDREQRALPEHKNSNSERAFHIK
jgi:hypothetical protein